MALAPDIYHGDTFDYADRERALARLNEVDDDVAMREVSAALDMLVAQARATGASRSWLLHGGRLAFLANAEHGERLAASVSFYGGGIAPSVPRGRRKPLVDRAEDVVAPQLLIYGGATRRSRATSTRESPRRCPTRTSDTRSPVARRAARVRDHRSRELFRAGRRGAWRIAFGFFVDTFMQGSAAGYN